VQLEDVGETCDIFFLRQRTIEVSPGVFAVDSAAGWFYKL
jgi:hypothetical protein